MIKINKVPIFMGLFLLLAGLMTAQEQTAYAAAPITIAEVDYEEEEVVVNNNSNTKILFASEAEAAKDNWEVMLADAGATSTVDFSWVSRSLDNIIIIKGQDDPTGTKSRIVLPKKTSKLDISINYSTINTLSKTESIASLINIMTTAGTGEEPIDFNDLEWKKGEGGKWKPIDLLTVAQLEKYQIKGTDLYFRIKAVNDTADASDPANIIYPDGSKGRRVSSETKVKIAKKAASMVVGIDGSEFSAEIKYGKEYRLTIDGVRTDWIKVYDRAVKRISLSDIVENLGDLSDGMTDAFPSIFLEIRSYATDKAAASKITEISLDAQRELSSSLVIEGEAPGVASPSDQNIYISYNGNKNMVVTIPSASIANPYEYATVKPGDTFDLERVTWSSITKNTDVKILGSKAVEGGVLYIRQKEIKYKEATRTTAAIGYQLSSTYVTHNIKYPSVPEIDTESFTYIKGMVNLPVEFVVHLNTIGKKPFETKIDNIKLGTQEIAFTQVLSPDISPVNPVDITKEYIITVTLDSAALAAMGNAYSRALTINFENGTVNNTSVKLTIKNPTPALAMTASAQKGTVAGTTKVDIVSFLGTGNSYAYYYSAVEVEDIYVEGLASLPAYTNYNSGDNITTPAGYIIMLEINPATGTVVKFKCIEITANEIA